MSLTLNFKVIYIIVSCSLQNCFVLRPQPLYFVCISISGTYTNEVTMTFTLNSSIKCSCSVIYDFIKPANQDVVLVKSRTYGNKTVLLSLCVEVLLLNESHHKCFDLIQKIYKKKKRNEAIVPYGIMFKKNR